MSFVGKILVVVQLILSVCFMAFAGAVSATQTNWKKKFDALTTSNKALQAKFDETQTEYKNFQDNTKKEQVALQSQAGNLQAQNVLLQGKVDTLTQENEDLKTTSTRKSAVADVSADEALARRAESLTLRELYKKSLEAKDVEFQAKTKLEDEKFELTVELEKIKSDFTSMLRENKKLKDVLIKNGLPTELADYDKQTTPPPSTLKGVVLDRKITKQGTEYVEISVGSDDGLLKGHHLYVYSSAAKGAKAKYLGKIEIIHTSPDRAVGMVQEKAKNGIIEEGDNVAAKL